MKFQCVKGTRDFYPPEMRLRQHITDAWRRVSLRNGFEEYDSPIFEYLDLYKAKSGEGIVSELFSLTDRGGRELAVRPETTPTLARMVNARVNTLPRPIKWFTIQRCCRAERPQKGRTREFFCWNIDIIGEPSEIADAESVLVAVDGLRELGLTTDDVVVRYSSRELLAGVLGNFGVGEREFPDVMAAIDKRSKLPAEAWDEAMAKAVPDGKARMGILSFLNMRSIGAGAAASIAQNVGMEVTQVVVEAIAKLQRFESQLTAFGVKDWCRYDTNIVRGLAYYTGIVYEIHDRGQSLRAVAGGGRYDNLLEVLGGPKIGGTGFGMGDVVLGILLAEKGKVPDLRESLEFFVIDGVDGAFEKVMEVVGALRAKGRAADFSYKRQPIGKQLKEANRRGARKALIVRAGRLAVKDLATGNQHDLPIEEFLRTLEDR